jgi:hypothetical protein
MPDVPMVAALELPEADQRCPVGGVELLEHRGRIRRGFAGLRALHSSLDGRHTPIETPVRPQVPVGRNGTLLGRDRAGRLRVNGVHPDGDGDLMDSVS